MAGYVAEAGEASTVPATACLRYPSPSLLLRRPPRTRRPLRSRPPALRRLRGPLPRLAPTPSCAGGTCERGRHRADQVEQALRPKVAVNKSPSTSPQGDVLRPHRPQRRREDHHLLDDVRLPPPRRQGIVRVLGARPGAAGALKGKVGVLPQDALLPPGGRSASCSSTGRRLSGLDAPERRRARGARARCGLRDAWNVAARSALARHGQARGAGAGAASAIPPVVLLDEPTAGLDPRVAVQVRQLIKELQGAQHASSSPATTSRSSRSSATARRSSIAASWSQPARWPSSPARRRVPRRDRARRGPAAPRPARRAGGLPGAERSPGGPARPPGACGRGGRRRRRRTPARRGRALPRDLARSEPRGAGAADHLSAGSAAALEAPPASGPPGASQGRRFDQRDPDPVAGSDRAQEVTWPRRSRPADRVPRRHRSPADAGAHPGPAADGPGEHGDRHRAGQSAGPPPGSAARSAPCSRVRRILGRGRGHGGFGGVDSWSPTVSGTGRLHA